MLKSFGKTHRSSRSVLFALIALALVCSLWQIPLAVSQPGDDSGGQDRRSNTHGCRRSCMGVGPRHCHPAERTDHYHAHASKHFRQDRHGQNGHERQGYRRVG